MIERFKLKLTRLLVLKVCRGECWWKDLVNHHSCWCPLECP